MAKPRKKKTLGSYPYLTGVLSISLALFIMGLFGLLLIYTGRLTELIQENIEIQVYLDRNLSNADRELVGEELRKKPWVFRTDAGPAVRYISREEAAQKFIAETGEDFVNFLGDNPLRDAYVIKVGEQYADPSHMANIRKEIEAMSGIFEAEYVESLVQVVSANVSRISLFLLVTAAVLVIGVVILINNTIKLALFSQRFLIRSMQLVGARQWFILRPFVTRAIVQGLIGGVLAVTAIKLLMAWAHRQVPDLRFLEQPFQLNVLLAAVLFTGALLGGISAYFSVNKYLKLSLDELY